MLLRFKDDKDGGSIEGEVDLSRSRFNPLESWIQAGEVLKSTNPRLNSGHPSRPSPPDQGIPTRLPEVPYTPPVSTPVTPPVTNGWLSVGGGIRNPNIGAPYEPHPPTLPSAGQGYTPIEFPPVGVPQGMPPGQPSPDPTAGGPPNEFGMYPPPTTAYGPTPLSGGLQEPWGPYAPPGYPSNAPYGDPYSTPTPLPNTGPPGLSAPTAAEGQDAMVSDVQSDWNATLQQAEVPPAKQAQQDATIKTSAQQNNGSSTVGGSPASDDPAMQRQWGELAYDPTKRKEEYTKRMNTIFMQAMLLDVAARTMGVPSRAGAFMEHSMKVLEGEMKFDDQQRLYEITQGVFYPNGTYDPPRTQREGFERAMALGATAEEAAAISGYMPEDADIGWDTYYQANPDGTVQTIYVPKGQAPPQGATDASGIATHNAGINNPDAASVPTAMEIEAQVNSWMSEADSLEAAGDKAGADALRQRAENLLALGGGKSKTNEYSYAQANSTFNSLYGGMMRETGMGRNKDNTMRDANGNYIPWGVFRQRWLTSWDVPVTGKDGVVRSEPGWLQISASSKVQELPSTERIASPSDIMKLREAVADGNEQAIPDFIEYFGADQLPDEFRSEGGGW